MTTDANRRREAELRVTASELDEKVLRARVTRNPDLLAEAEGELRLIKGELAELRAERLGNQIDAAIEQPGAPDPAQTATDDPFQRRAMSSVEVIGPVRERLLDGLRAANQALTAVIGARVQPTAVLSESADVERSRTRAQPATLELPAGSSDVLGPNVQTRVVVEEETTRIWVAGLTELAPGDVVVAAAIAPDGQLVDARGEVDAAGRARIDLQWGQEEPPSSLVLAVERS